MIMTRLTSWGCVLWISVAMASLMGSSGAGSSSSAILIKVDPSGRGDYKKIQDAIDAVPSNNAELYFIWIKPGIYREKIVIPDNKPFITLSGTNANTTIITGSDGSSVVTSATLTVLASNFVARFLTIQNTYGPGIQAVALRVSGDKAAFYGCRIIAYQDTLFDDNGRHYYNNCYIEGAIDFICGNALSLFEKCSLHSVSDGNGAITAQRRSSPSENTGFSFINCKVTGTRSAILGRPWGAYSRVVFALSYMANVVLPQGWDDWNNPSNQRTAFYGEYRCYGAGSDVSKRVGWSHQLSSAEVAPFLTKSMINGREWLMPSPTRFRRASTTSVEKVDNK
ncbi:putative pectinesterase 11 [Magnolia sinica]|uniref:putative pectinesterase 11 n=1 Tax=Magnolia sinica TaxID=86752 RepID=UPI00265B2AE6|nr:putative pectinesterase 11 [Magnolia sinica]